MKKYFLVLITFLCIFTLTGCDEEEAKNPTSIPSELQGIYKGEKYTSGAEKYTGITYYYVYSVENNIIKRKICSVGNYDNAEDIKKECNFDDGKTGLYQTHTYDVKDIEWKYRPNENIFFNMYEGDKKYAECYTNFGSISCTTNEDDYLRWSKKD